MKVYMFSSSYFYGDLVGITDSPIKPGVADGSRVHCRFGNGIVMVEYPISAIGCTDGNVIVSGSWRSQSFEDSGGSSCRLVSPSPKLIGGVRKPAHSKQP